MNISFAILYGLFGSNDVIQSVLSTEFHGCIHMESAIRGPEE